MQLDIPVPCPKCGGRMHCIGYDVVLKVLKERTWQVCKECSFTRSTDEFKDSLLCI